MAKTDLTESEAIEVMQRRRLIAVVRCDLVDQLRQIAGALVEGGIDIIEVTMTVPNAIQGLSDLVNYIGKRAVVGAGTVTDPESCIQAIDAGASFIVSPCLIPEVVGNAVKRGVLTVPGCFTPTEVFAATQLGAPIVKLFPASVLGPRFVREMHGPFPSLKTMLTGGITLDNISEFLEAGADVIGLGGHLVDKVAIGRGDFQAIANNASAFRALVGK